MCTSTFRLFTYLAVMSVNSRKSAANDLIDAHTQINASYLKNAPSTPVKIELESPSLINVPCLIDA